MENNKEYEEFVEKFKPKLTTDDCYTPDEVYNAVVEFVENEYGVNRDNFVRPFYPNGDYEAVIYKEEEIVVDNPPFSILSKIVRYYIDNGIKFFLFAPALTTFSGSIDRCCCLCSGVSITYENGAKVNTSFLTNLEPEAVQFKSAPRLYGLVEKANRIYENTLKKQLPKYTYPDHVVTAAMVNRYSKHGVEFSVDRGECVRVGALDAMRKVKKAIFGDGYLLSDKAAADKIVAERETEKNATQTAESGGGVFVWELSEREKGIIKQLGKKEE